jgi:hypothetical protein
MCLKKIISNSVFYICDGFNDLSIQFISRMYPFFKIHNHILVNFDTYEPEFIPFLTRLKGYSFEVIKELSPTELFNNSIQFILPPMLNASDYATSLSNWKGEKKMKAFLLKLNKLDSLGKNLSSTDINIICVHGDPLFAFQGIYRGNNLSPKLVMTTSNGWGWREYEDFKSTNNSLEWMISKIMVKKESFVASTVHLDWNNLEVLPTRSRENDLDLCLYKLV